MSAGQSCHYHTNGQFWVQLGLPVTSLLHPVSPKPVHRPRVPFIQQRSVEHLVAVNGASPWPGGSSSLTRETIHTSYVIFRACCEGPQALIHAAVTCLFWPPLPTPISPPNTPPRPPSPSLRELGVSHCVLGAHQGLSPALGAAG